MTTRGTFLFLLLASAAAAQVTTTTMQATDKISPGVQQALAQGATVLPTVYRTAKAATSGDPAAYGGRKHEDGPGKGQF